MNSDDPSVSLPVYKVSEPPTHMYRYELVGRSTWLAEVQPVIPPTDETSNDTPKFLKLSWPEVQRFAEYKVVRTAHSRVGQVEYTGIKELVEKHAPKVLGYKDYPHTLTATIRHL